MSTRSYRDAVADSLEGLAEHRPARRTRVDGQTNQVEALRQLSQQVSRELDTVQLAAALSRSALEAMHACRVVVALAQAEHLQVVGEHATRSGDEFSQEFIESLVARVASQRRHQFVDHASRHQAVLGVPIVNHQSRVLGVIGFLGRPHGFYRQADLPMAESIANIAAIGFDRALLFDRMHEWTHSLESLLAFNAAVNQRLSSDGLLQKLVQHAVQFLKSKAGMAGLAVPTTQGSNEMRSTSYFLEGDWIERPRTWQTNQGLAGAVLETEFPIVANDYAAHPQCDPALASEFGVARSICVPIKNSKGEMLGFFEVHRGVTGDDFSWQDAAFLESLGNTAAVGIENARLIRSIELKQKQIEALSAKNVAQLETERQRIARELHDETGQMLIGMKLSLQLISRLLPAECEQAHAEIEQLRTNVRRSAIQMRDLSKRLRPPTLDQLGFENALNQLASDFENRGDIRFHIFSVRDLPQLPDEMATAFYRIAQEALTNVIRHAQATDVWLRLTFDGLILRLEIEDNGTGFDTESAHHGLGLLGMRERVAILGGVLDIESTSDGTKIRAGVTLDG